MCACEFICVHVYLYVYMCTDMCTCVFMCVHVYLDEYTCIYMCLPLLAQYSSLSLSHTHRVQFVTRTITAVDI